MKICKIKKVRAPQYSSEGAAGIDFFIPESMNWESFTLLPGTGINIPSGIKVELAANTCLLAVNKSSIGKLGLQIGACLIDEDYRGEIHLNVNNISNTPITILRGQKLVQFILLPILKASIEEVTELNETKRGSGAFGSTGL